MAKRSTSPTVTEKKFGKGKVSSTVILEPAAKSQVHLPWRGCISQSLLLEWLDNPENYAKYKFAGQVRPGDGRSNSTGQTKIAVLQEIVQPLKDHGVNFRTVVQVRNKVRDWEASWKKAYDFLQATGEGLTTEDEKLEIPHIKEKVLKDCRLWEQLNPIFSQRAGNAPIYTGDSEDSPEDAMVLLRSSGCNDATPKEVVNGTFCNKEAGEATPEDFISPQNELLESESMETEEDICEPKISAKKSKKNNIVRTGAQIIILS